MTKSWNVITKAKPGTPEFDVAHKGKIGGHMACDILGVGRRTPLEAWARLTGKLDEPARSDPNDDGDEDEVQASVSEQMELGNDLEPVVASVYERRTKHKLAESPGMIAHPELDWLVANPDRIINYGDGRQGVLECKSAGGVKLSEWIGEPPVQAQVQLHTYLLCTGLEAGAIAALLGTFGFKFVFAEVTINPVFADHLMNELVDFREKYWLPDIPPPATGRDLPIVRMLHPEADGSTIELTDEMAITFEQFEQTKAEIRDLEKLKADMQVRLLEGIGPASFARGAGVSFSAKTTHVEGRTQIVQPYSFRTLRRCK